LDWNSSKIVMVRFANPGAACYINAALQLLACVAVKNWGLSSAGTFLNTLRKAKVDDSNETMMVFDDINEFVDDDYRYEGYQQDAHEILLHVLNCLRTDVLINKIFGLVTTSVTKCMACHNVSERESTEWQLTVDSSATGIKDYFTKYFVPERLLEGYECERCTISDKTVRTPAERHQRIKQWPPYLLFQIMRFQGDRKLTESFDFPLAFYGTEPTDPEYVLEAAVLHLGATMSSGHYVTVAFNPAQDQYYLYDDDREPRPKKLAEVTSPAHKKSVYLLLYRSRPRKN